MTILAT